MVAYSFQARFIEPILAGTKRQTIRAQGRRRHAYAGDELQLYFGMRTKHCRLIARATCVQTTNISLHIGEPGHFLFFDPEAFARADGFASWADMMEFWRVFHPGVVDFNGVLVQWGDMHDEE